MVSTTGSAEIRVVPDVADLYFSVEVRHPDLAQARKLQADRATKVLAALREAGVKEAELQASQVRIMPRYDDSDSRDPFPVAQRAAPTGAVRYYTVSQDIACTLHDIKKVPNVTADAVAAGVTRVQDASLRTSELRKHRDQARANAIRAAKEKAVALAGELGVKLGRPYTITEGSAYSSNYWASNRSNLQQSSEGGGAAGNEEAAPTFAPGTISVTASVSVSFLLE